MATATVGNALIKLDTNVPQVLALAFADGKRFVSKIPGAPDQVLFSFTNGARAFWPIALAEQIKLAGIGANVPFQVIKLSGRDRYDIKPVEVAAKAERETEQSWQNVPSHPATQTPIKTPTPTQDTPPRAHPPDAPVPPNGMAERYMACFAIAVDVALATENYAERKGMDVRATFEDVRAMAATVFINEYGGRR